MKKMLTTIVVFFCLSLFQQLHAATYMDGYVVKDGDTIYCKIKTWSAVSGLTQTRIQDEIVTKDSAGNEVIYLPTEIQGFGFKYGTEQMTFVPKVPKGGVKPIFMRVILRGKNLNLYSYSIASTTQIYRFNSAPTTLKGDKSIYLIEDVRERTVALESGALDNGKRMKEFFSDKPELLKLYKQKQPTFYQIPDFVFIANTQK